ncbi:MAG: bifunctional nuclease family protein [Bacteroidales bacterium]|jgi:bifunctional DNase/RNase|nr:bifunctional nuclease family protein [Bacteroidales bacterium]HOL98871.1 bifunctional nuclease family protein [Bacteroidales bacterium]HPD24712.1 bifunctional nuclease family protein [Bacteroidales bacterium]HRT00457.1 bifunctional nuclease family protein [Bacteroidales bacterium]HRT80931.1 bifunctional nuclease family protein [Bacteroidales bacterium]
MDKIKLEVLGLSYSQTQVGAYALILSVKNSEERIPIIIGGFEAQAIAIQLEGLKPPRPLTHDLFFKFAEIVGYTVSEVFIHSLDEGIFYSKIFIKNNNTGDSFEIDSRTSDAVALALRFNAPIYTTPQIVQKAGILINITEEDKESINPKESKQSTFKRSSLEDLSVEELEVLLNEAIEKEEYEKASKIRDIINKKKTRL